MIRFKPNVLKDTVWVATELDALEIASLRPEPDREAIVAQGRELLRRAEVLGNREVRFIAAAVLAGALSDVGRFEEALALLDAHQPLVRPFARHLRAVTFGAQRVRALRGVARRSGDAVAWEEVDRAATDVIERFEELRTKVTLPQVFSAVTRLAIEAYAGAVEARLALGRPEDALACIELVKCRSLHRLIGEKAAPRAELRARFETLCREIDARVQAGQEVDEERRRDRRHQSDLIAVERLRERAGDVPTFSVSGLQARLPEATAAVSWFWLDRERLVVAAVDRTRVVAEIVPCGATVRADIDRRADAIHRETKLRALRPSIALPPALTDALLPPRIRSVLGGNRRLVLSPHRTLHALPLHALPWGERKVLLHDFAVSYAPNWTTLMRGPRPRRPDPRVLFVGVPARAVGLPGGPLDGVVRELEPLKARYGTRLVAHVGPEGRKADLGGPFERLQDYSLLHFACHGTNVDSENPMESALLLYDADLDGLEISGLEAKASVVVLSACSSAQRALRSAGEARDDDLPGDEVFGLQAAFFAAGTDGVLAALWPADDGVACLVTEGFHARWATAPADVALQQSLLECLSLSGLLRREPERWASFSLTVSCMPEELPGGPP